jgi:hypothetical protein
MIKAHGPPLKLCPECEGLTVICSCGGNGCSRCNFTGTGRCTECGGSGTVEDVLILEDYGDE